MADLRIGGTVGLKAGGVVAITPQEYLGVIESLGVFSFQVEAETTVEAKAGIRECDRVQHVVRRAKKAITLDIERCLEYQKQLEAAGPRVRVFGQRKRAGFVGPDKKGRIRRQMKRMVQPYESMIHQLDAILDQVDDRVRRLRGVIDE